MILRNLKKNAGIPRKGFRFFLFLDTFTKKMGHNRLFFMDVSVEKKSGLWYNSKDKVAYWLLLFSA
jgi:hypothetical protein